MHIAVAIPLVRRPDPAGTLERRKREDRDLDARAAWSEESFVRGFGVLVADDEADIPVRAFVDERASPARAGEHESKHILVLTPTLYESFVLLGRHGYKIVLPSALATSSTASCAVAFSRSRIGFTSTTSIEPAIRDSATSSSARWASR